MRPRSASGQARGLSKIGARFPGGVWLGVALALVDLLGVVTSFLIAFYVRRWLGEHGVLFERLQPALGFFLPYWPVVFLWPLLYWVQGLYPGAWETPDQELKDILRGASLAGLTVVILTFVTQTGGQFSRPILVGWWLLTLIILPLNHLGLKAIIPGLGLRGSPAVILGTSPEAEQLVASLLNRPIPVIEPVAAFAAPGDRTASQLWGLPILGGIERASEWAAEHNVGIALVVMPQLSQEDLVSTADQLSMTFRRVLLVPNLYGLSTAETDVRDIDGVLALEMRRNLLVPSSRWSKRLLDIVLGGAMAIVSLPLMAVIAAALALERQGSVFYGHSRVGKAGASFTAWKFRTMVRNAETVLERALDEDPRLRAEWTHTQKLRHDPRLTKVGRLLRRLSLDELPQLWNILRFEMSLVGPRPIVREEIHKYGAAIDLYFQVRPGLTGLWQVSGRSNLSYEERVHLDAYYVRNWSVWLDLVIILRTFIAVLTGRGAY